MLARLRKAQENNEGGFTLIELLVVMIIIGILAAIAIPAFLSQKQKAQDTAAKADVSTLGKELAAYYVDREGEVTVAISGGKYTVDGVEAGNVSKNVQLNTAYGSTVTAGTSVKAGTGTTGTAFCISVTNAQGKQKTYKYSSATGLGEGSCTSATA